MQIALGPRYDNAAGTLQRGIELVDVHIVCNDAVFHVTFTAAVTIGVDRYLICSADAILIHHSDPDCAAQSVLPAQRTIGVSVILVQFHGMPGCERGQDGVDTDIRRFHPAPFVDWTVETIRHNKCSRDWTDSADHEVFDIGCLELDAGRNLDIRTDSCNSSVTAAPQRVERRTLVPRRRQEKLYRFAAKGEWMLNAKQQINRLPVRCTRTGNDANLLDNQTIGSVPSLEVPGFPDRDLVQRRPHCSCSVKISSGLVLSRAQADCRYTLFRTSVPFVEFYIPLTQSHGFNRQGSCLYPLVAFPSDFPGNRHADVVRSAEELHPLSVCVAFKRVGSPAGAECLRRCQQFLVARHGGDFRRHTLLR